MEDPSTLVSTLGLVVLGLYTFVWSISILGLVQAKRLFGKRSAFRDATPASSPASLPGVSILRPLAGLDHNLALNLSSSFEQVYPSDKFEIILSVKDEFDQARPVAEEISSRYPHIESTLVVGDESCGVNPKVANLVKPYAIAKHDIIWVLDSQCALSPHALLRAVQSLQSTPKVVSPSTLRQRTRSFLWYPPRVGLVHHVPLGVSPRASMGSFVEAAFLGGNHAKMYMAINSLAIDSCVVGKSNLWRKSDLQRVPDKFFGVGDQGTRGEAGAIGGTAFRSNNGNEIESSLECQNEQSLVSAGPSRALARFAIYLAEDNMLALSLWRPPLSLTHVLQPLDVVRCSVGDIRSIGDYAARRMRWIRVRKHMVPAATYLEPFTESVLVACLAIWAFLYAWVPLFMPRAIQQDFARVWASGFAFAHFALWHLVDFEVLRTLQEANALGLSSHGDALPSGTSQPVPVIDWTDASLVRKLRLAWVLREVLAFPIWLWAMCGNTVVWRHRRYRILSDARAAASVDYDGGALSCCSISVLIKRWLASSGASTADGYEYVNL